MPTLRMGMKPVAGLSVTGRFLATAVDICGSGLKLLTRIVRIRRDRAWLDELPDYLLRDIGIKRSEISSAIWFGGRPGRGDLWIRRPRSPGDGTPLGSVGRTGLSKTVDRPDKRC